MECPPARREKTAWLTNGFVEHGTGSLPQLPPGVTLGVIPINTPKSKTLKESPIEKASVTVKVPPPAPNVNVQGGAGANVELPPELGTHPRPNGSAGKQPRAKTPGPVKENSCQSPPTGTGSARVEEAIPKMAPITTNNISILGMRILRTSCATDITFSFRRDYRMLREAVAVENATD
jgi:hypothetical protein